MTEDLPTGPRLDRASVERIIKRAAELQAGERDIGESLSEGELIQLGHDVGIPDALLRQAMLEERTRVDIQAEEGVLAWLTGPRMVSVARAIPGDAGRIEKALHQWMDEGELLQVRRRFPQQTSWEARQGAMAAIRRAVSLGGRSYALTRAREVIGQVTALDASRAHVRLVADLSNTRRERLGWGAGMTVAGAASGAVAVVLGIAFPIAVIPPIVGGAIGWIAARSRRSEIEKVHVALEQVLDRLEHGEIELQKEFRGPRQSAFIRIADELLKKGLGPGK